VGPGSLYKPFDINDDRTIEAYAGTTIYVLDTFNDERLGVTEKDITRVEPRIDEKNRSGDILKSPVKWLKISDKTLPEDWTRIVRQELIYEITSFTETGSRWSARYLDYVDVVYAISIPADASGLQSMKIVVDSIPGKLEKQSLFLIDIQEPLVNN